MPTPSRRTTWRTAALLLPLALGVVPVGRRAAAFAPDTLATPPAAGPSQPARHRLMPSPSTVSYGHYWAEAKPVLRIRSGDELTIGTLLTSTPERLEGAGVRPEDVEPALRAIVDSVKDRGPGGHILTGPVYVEGAAPGDVLEVRIKQVELAIPYAYNAFRPGSGFLPEDFTAARMRIVPLDRTAMVGRFAPGIDVPLRPFFGSIGVAPPAARGRVSSAPPDIHAGNLDNKELVAGTTLYIPVHVPGALLQLGDGHAAQGDGEVDITGLETSLVGVIDVIVRKDMALTWPRGETPTHWIAMGADRDLVVATRIAVRQAIELLVADRGLSREDAYMLVSVGCDVRITQLVDGNVGAHVMIPKALFTGKAATR
jgi:acetamidase/formamidase